MRCAYPPYQLETACRRELRRCGCSREQARSYVAANFGDSILNSEIKGTVSLAASGGVAGFPLRSGPVTLGFLQGAVHRGFSPSGKADFVPLPCGRGAPLRDSLRFRLMRATNRSASTVPNASTKALKPFRRISTSVLIVALTERPWLAAWMRREPSVCTFRTLCRAPSPPSACAGRGGRRRLSCRRQ